MRKLLILSVLIAVAVQLNAQPPISFYDNTRIYREALELFDHEKYVPAMEKFQEYTALEKDPQHALRINSEYYSGICALYLLHKDAEYQLEQFVLEHPDSPWKMRAYFELATFNYQKKRTRIGANATFSLSRRYSLYASVVDLGGFVQNQQRYAPDTPEYARPIRWQELGFYTNVGVRGSF